MYDRLLVQDAEATTAAVTTGIAATHLGQSETGILAPVDSGARNGKVRETGRQNNLPLHPDLQELNFGPLGASSTDLPPPLRPSTSPYGSSNRNIHRYEARGSLSDFSDYNSSEEEHGHLQQSSSQTKAKRDLLDDSEGSDDNTASSGATVRHSEDADPFADPFADNVGGSSKMTTTF